MRSFLVDNLFCLFSPCFRLQVKRRRRRRRHKKSWNRNKINNSFSLQNSLLLVKQFCLFHLDAVNVQRKSPRTETKIDYCKGMWCGCNLRCLPFIHEDEKVGKLLNFLLTVFLHDFHLVINKNFSTKTFLTFYRLIFFFFCFVF